MEVWGSNYYTMVFLLSLSLSPNLTLSLIHHIVHRQLVSTPLRRFLSNLVERA